MLFYGDFGLSYLLVSGDALQNYWIGFKSLYNCCLSQNLYFLTAFLFCEHSAKVGQKWQDHSRIKAQPSWQGDEEGWWCSVNSKVALWPMWSSQWLKKELDLHWLSYSRLKPLFCVLRMPCTQRFAPKYSPRPIILHNHWHEQMCNATSNTIKYVLA